MNIKFTILFLLALALMSSCSKQNSEKDTAQLQDVAKCTNVSEENGIIIYHPDYLRIDLVCGSMPSVQEDSVIFCASASFTGQLLDNFKHSNIGGDHVSGGVLFKGVKMGRNSGAFVFYGGKYQFLYKDGIKAALMKAANNGGMGFCQEMMIHKGQKVKCTRKDSNKNEFRALCELNGKLCVIDSKGVSSFGDFIQNLLNVGVAEAIYLDMGPGWNFSWYRDYDGRVNYIHNRRISYTTNWITFYR